MKPFPAITPVGALRRYGVAIILAIIATMVRWGLHPVIDGHDPYFLTYPAVLLAAMYGGLVPGLVCGVLTTATAVYLFDSPFYDWAVSNVSGFIGSVFALGLILIAGSLQRRARLANYAAHEETHQHAVRLEHEIGRRTRIEESLRVSEKRLHLLIESAVEFAIISLDPDNRIVSWNEGAKRLLGYEEDEIVGKPGAIVFTPEDRAANAPELEIELASKNQRAINERWHVRRDGTRFWGSGAIMAMRDSAGRLLGFVKIVRDQTERRRTEIALRESEERYRALTQLNPDPVLVVVDSTIVFANPAATKLIGAQNPQQVLGKNVYNFVHEDYHDSVRDRIQIALTSGQPNPPSDRKLLRLDGETCDVEAVSALVPWEGRNAVQVILHDITERRRYEESLREASELHRLLLRELDHRVRNNLASLISLIEITSSGKTDVRKVANAIRSRTQAMAAVHELLSKQHWTTVDLGSLVQSLQPASSPGALHTSGPPVPIAARQVTAMGMMLQELFSNSTKYGALSVPAGTVEVQWQVRENPTSLERTLELQWTERGGPPPASENPSPSVGTGLIRGFVRSELRGNASLAYPHEGATHHFTLTLDPLPELDKLVSKN